MLLVSISLFGAECFVEKVSAIDVTWRAYKTPKKIGVDGGFLAVVYHGQERAEDLPSLLMKSQVMIEVNNVDSKDPFRDAKLVQFFFNIMQGAVIVADVVSVEGDDTSGTVTVNVAMNNRAIDVPLHYRVVEGGLTANGKLNLKDFHAEEALKMLTLNCYAPHEGMTWADVDVGFSFDIAERCDEKSLKQ